jgi:hypothetical protein
MLIFSLKIVFTMNFLKMGPICVRFSLGLLSAAGFHGENLLQRGASTPEELLRSSEAALAWFKLPLEHLKIRTKCSSGNPAPKSICGSEVRLL